MGLDRPRRQTLAGIALAAFVATLVLPWVLSSHRVGDRDIVGLFGGAETLGLVAGDDRDSPDHCAVCHWLRTVGDAASARPAALAVAADASDALPTGTAPGAGRFSAADAPSRAPPRLA